ncbi:GAF domain-containing protein [Vogesella oryzae]|uniref:GAF domain-containing protein n=1 Tax=Vogesella oryzae TaxID=1735285 RepID=UPI003CCD6CF2
MFGTPTALLSLVDHDRQWFKARHGMALTETPRELSLCGHVVADGNMLVVEDTRQDARFADNPLVTSLGMRFYAGAPLLLDDNHVIGTLCLNDSQPRQFGAHEQHQLQLLADTVCVLLRQRMANHAISQQCERLVSVNQAQAGFLLDRNMEPACAWLTLTSAQDGTHALQRPQGAVDADRHQQCRHRADQPLL